MSEREFKKTVAIFIILKNRIVSFTTYVRIYTNTHKDASTRCWKKRCSHDEHHYLNDGVKMQKEEVEQATYT